MNEKKLAVPEDPSMRFLFVPGYAGSGSDHWQSVWELDLGDRADRLTPASWTDADGTDLCAAIGRAVSGRTVLVAHSLGCLAAARWLAENRDNDVAGAFFVAPPDCHGQEFPAVRGFDQPAVRLSVPTVVLASSNDPYGAPAVTAELATAWGATVIMFGALGHLNASSGLGDWPEGRRLLQAFVAGLPAPAALG